MNKLERILPNSLLRSYYGKRKSNVLFEMFEENTFTAYKIIFNIGLFAIFIFIVMNITIFDINLLFYSVPAIFILVGIIIYGLTYYFEKITIGAINVILNPEERKIVGIKNDSPLYAVYVRRGFKILYLAIPEPDRDWSYHYIINKYSEDLSMENENLIDYVTTDTELIKDTIDWIADFYNIKNHKNLNIKLKWLKEI